MPHKILVADDNRDTIMILSTVLERAGYHVIIAADGEEAVQRALEEKPALILVDIMMPKRNGFEVCKEVKNHPGTKEIPVLIITAKADSRSRMDGFAVGACEYITKPLNPKQLLQKVKDHLPPGEPFSPSAIAAMLAFFGLTGLLWKVFQGPGSLLHLYRFGFSGLFR